MKSIKLLFVFLCAIVCCQSARAESEGVIIDGIKYILYSYYKQATVVANDYSGDIVIPATVTYGDVTYDVTELSWDCFYECKNLTSVSIPESITALGNRCFEGCSALTSINLPESITALGGGCFQGCSSLTSINIPESVTSLGGFCFARCSKLTDFTIPESVTSLGDYCFWGCESLTSIFIPKNVTSIGESCFSVCCSLSSIRVDIDNTVYDSFCFCNAIIETATSKMIAACRTTIIPKHVTSLGQECFMGMNVYRCTLPERVTSLGFRCFASSYLHYLQCWATTPPTVGEYCFDDRYPIKVYVPGKSLEAYRGDTSWNREPLHIYPFMEKIEMPASVKISQGEEQTLDFKYFPEDADAEALVWTSSDDNVATVDASGLCKALNIGTATIRAVSTDGSELTATCEVTVVEPTGIESNTANEKCGATFYTLNGIKQSNRPAKKGTYIRAQNGKSEKVVIR